MLWSSDFGLRNATAVPGGRTAHAWRPVHPLTSFSDEFTDSYGICLPQVLIMMISVHLTHSGHSRMGGCFNPHPPSHLHTQTFTSRYNMVGRRPRHPAAPCTSGGRGLRPFVGRRLTTVRSLAIGGIDRRVGRAVHAVRRPELKLNIPPSLFLYELVS